MADVYGSKERTKLINELMKRVEGIPGRMAKFEKVSAEEVLRHSRDLRLFELVHHRRCDLKHGLPSKKPRYRQSTTSSNATDDCNDGNGSRVTT